MFVYAAAATNVEPPGSSANRSTHSHDHDHAHGGHDHSQGKSNQPPSENTVVVPAPAGGPPPLLTEQPSLPTNERSDLQSESNSEIVPNSKPAASSPSLNSNLGCPPRSYTCTNARQYQYETANGVCSFDNAGYCPIESQDLQSMQTNFSHSQFHSRNYRDLGSPYEYDTRRYLVRPGSRGFSSACDGGQECHILHGD